MSNYPDDMNWTAHDACYAQADCLVDNWHKSGFAFAKICYGVGAVHMKSDDDYRKAVGMLNLMRQQAFDDCNCGNCENSDNWTTDGESLINDAMVSA